MRLNLLLSLSLTALFMTGCGPPRVDTSSEAALRASVDQMTAGMTDQQIEAFSQDCMLVASPLDFKADRNSSFTQTVSQTVGRMSSPAAMLKPLHGLSQAEISARANEIRQNRKEADDPGN